MSDNTCYVILAGFRGWFSGASGGCGCPWRRCGLREDLPPPAPIRAFSRRVRAGRRCRVGRPVRRWPPPVALPPVAGFPPVRVLPPDGLGGAGGGCSASACSPPPPVRSGSNRQRLVAAEGSFPPLWVAGWRKICRRTLRLLGLPVWGRFFYRRKSPLCGRVFGGSGKSAGCPGGWPPLLGIIIPEGGHSPLPFPPYSYPSPRPSRMA